MLDGVERILRGPASKQGWSLLALHLSRLPAPGPLAHHNRIAASVLGDAAGRGGGQLFALSNSDLALLFRPPDGGVAVLATLSRLFQTDATDAATLRTLWTLPDGGEDAIGYVRNCIAEMATSIPSTNERDGTDAIAIMDDIVHGAPAAGLMRRQTAVLLRPGNAEPIVPIFREVAISTALVRVQIVAGGGGNIDDLPFNHLSLRLDRRTLALLTDDFLTLGPLSGGLDVAALHINLTLAGILSDAFANFANASQKAINEGLRFGIELPFVDVFADAKAFLLARERLKLAGMTLILDGVTHHALMISNLAALNSDLVKLNWSPELQHCGARLRASIDTLGHERITLNHADSELAITWGMSQGIVRYQGLYVDHMLAAERMQACHSSKLCKMRECMERAAGACPALRRSCMNNSLLDRGSPLRVRPSTPVLLN